MKREAFDCDVCGASDLPIYTQLELITDRKMDAAGDMDDYYSVLTLCPICSVRALEIVESLLNDRRDYVLNQQVLRTITEGDKSRHGSVNV